MAGEVTSVTVTEQTLYNLTIVEDDSNVVTVAVPDSIATIEVSHYDVSVTMSNVGTGEGVFKSKSIDNFALKSIKDDDKTIDITSGGNNDQINVKLPDAGISTPDNFTINADSDSSAKIELPGATVDLSKAKLLTDLDVNSKDLDSVNTITATTGAITTVNATTINTTDLNVTDDLVVTDDLTVSGGVAIQETLNVFGNTTFSNDVALASGKTLTTPILSVGTSSTINQATITTATINNGTIDNTTVGASTSSTGRFTTLASDSVDLNGGAIDGTTIGATTPSTIVTTDLTATTADINAGTIDNTTIGATTPSTIVTTDLTATTADINGGTIDGTTIGASVSSTGVFSTLNSETVDINGGAIDGTTIGSSNPSTIVTSNLTATTADINAGTIDNTVIGATTPAAVTTTSLIATTADINAGTIDNSVIGATTPVAGTFTTATATTVNATDVNATGTGTIGTLNVTGNTVLTGNLTVNGTQTIVNTETLTVDDNIIVLNNNEAGTPSQNGGIEIERGTSDNAVFQWTESTDKWEAKVGSSYAALKVEDVNTNTLTATTGNITNMTSSNVDITGGSIDNVTITNIGAINGTTIGATTSATGRFSTMTTDNAVITGGSFSGSTASLTTSLIVDDGSTGANDTDTLTVTPTGITIYDSGNGTTVPQNTLSLSAQTVNTPLLTVGSANGYEDSTIGTTTAPTWGSSGTYPFWNLYQGANIGSVNKPFAQLHIASIYGNRTASGTPGIGLQNTLIPLKTDVSDGTSGDIHLGGSGADEYFDKAYIDQLARTLKTQSLVPLTDRTYDLGNTGGGDSTKYFANGYFDHLETQSLKAPDTSDGGDIGSNIEIIGNLIPDGDKTRNLGSPTKAFHSVYVGDGSLYVDGAKVLGSGDGSAINMTTDDGQDLYISAGGASGTAGELVLESRENKTSLTDTTINLGGFSGNSATINAYGPVISTGTVTASDFSGGGFAINNDAITNADGGATITTTQATDGSGYIHLNTPDVYVGPFGGAVKIDESSISVTNANGDLNLTPNGTGAVKVGTLALTTNNITQTTSDQPVNITTSGSNAYINVTAPAIYLGTGATNFLTLTPSKISTETSGSTRLEIEAGHIAANPANRTFPPLVNWGPYDIQASTSNGLFTQADSGAGFPIFAVARTDAVGESQATASYFVNSMQYDHHDQASNMAGHGTEVRFAAQDQAGNLHELGANLVKMRGVTTGGSAGSSTVTGYDGEYTLTLGKYNDFGLNALTVNKDFTQATNEIRVTNTLRNSGSTSLSGLYLTNNTPSGNAQTGTPSAKIQLRNEGTTTTTNLMDLEEDRVTQQVIQKMHTASSDPTGEEGDFYFNTTTKKFRGYNGSAWVNFHG